MIRAAGILIVCRSGDRPTALFIRRGPGSDFPGCWHPPGGRLEEGETPAEAAERETFEEAGPCSYGLPRELMVAIDADRSDGEVVEYTTFVADAPGEFRAVLNWENTAWCWAPIDDPPLPLHPGAQKALDRLTGTSLADRAVEFGEAIQWSRDHSAKIDAALAGAEALSARATLFDA